MLCSPWNHSGDTSGVVSPWRESREYPGHGDVGALLIFLLPALFLGDFWSHLALRVVWKETPHPGWEKEKPALSSAQQL